MYTREEPQVGDIVTMPMPFLGYRRIELIEKLQSHGGLVSATAGGRSRFAKMNLGWTNKTPRSNHGNNRNSNM